jgi:hypothetical protein
MVPVDACVTNCCVPSFLRLDKMDVCEFPIKPVQNRESGFANPEMDSVRPINQPKTG